MECEHFKVTPRLDCCPERQAAVAIFIDGSSEAAALTPNPWSRGTAYDMMDHKKKNDWVGKVFKLDWKSDHFAQVQWLEIDYQEVTYEEWDLNGEKT